MPIKKRNREYAISIDFDGQGAKLTPLRGYDVRTVDRETKVRLGEIESKATEALMEELRDRKIEAIFSVNTVDDTSTS